MRAVPTHAALAIALAAACGPSGPDAPQGEPPTPRATTGAGGSGGEGSARGEDGAGGRAAPGTEGPAARGSEAPDARPADETNAAAPAGEAPPPGMAPLLEAHDRMRARHCAPPLSWSAEIARTAQRWADRLAARGCSLQHSREPYGENIAAGSAGALDASTVAERWYREKAQYDFDAGGFSMQTGHFTQLVWVGSRRLGCGRASCRGRGMDLWVCMYDPPGNMRGEYAGNVRPASCER